MRSHACRVALVALTSLATVVPWVFAARAAGATAPPPAAWTRPVPGALVAPFVAPAFRFGAGHRGADLAAPPGTRVVAAGDGVVAFAGAVAGSLHVVIAHAGGLRTGYSFLASVAVSTGGRVRRGDVVGTAGGTGPGHAVGVLHLSLRVGDTYVDPMQLFAPPDLSRVVHLAPPRDVDEPGPIFPAREEALIAAELSNGGGGGVLRMFGDAIGAAGDALGTAAGAVADAGRAALGAGRVAAEWVWRNAPLASVARDATAAGRRLADWARSRLNCTSDPPTADGTGGSGHALIVVAGISSSWDGTGNAIGLPAHALGYDDSEVRSFSYNGAFAPYTAADTWGDLDVAAIRLGAQLRQMQRENPGREVDLVAHSQGGVVVDLFLQHVYDAADPAYPPIGTVVTLSSPHRGAPIATAARDVGTSPAGKAVLGAAAGAVGLPSPDAPAARQLAEGSGLMTGLWRHRLPDHVDFTSIGAPDDPVVPASQIDVPGGQRVVVDPAGVLQEHDAITHDARAMSAVRLALEGRPPPCVGVGEALRDAVEPVAITRLEHAAGHVGRAVGALVP